MRMRFRTTRATGVWSGTIRRAPSSRPRPRRTPRSARDAGHHHSSRAGDGCSPGSNRARGDARRDVPLRSTRRTVHRPHAQLWGDRHRQRRARGVHLDDGGVDRGQGTGERGARSASRSLHRRADRWWPVSGNRGCCNEWSMIAVGGMTRAFEARPTFGSRRRTANRASDRCGAHAGHRAHVAPGAVAHTASSFRVRIRRASRRRPSCR